MSESFNWSHSKLDWSHFHSLANLLSLRNGGQAEPSSLADTVLKEDGDFDDDEDGDARSIDTGLADKISGSGHEKLKQKFLDCLAEFAANKHGGTMVACSAMKEGEDNVIVWISRNEGFLDTDKPVFEKLGGSLGSLSCGNGDESETALWNEMMSYHQSRFQSNYIPNLRASFKAYDAAHMGNNTKSLAETPEAEAGLSTLRTLLFDQNQSDKGPLERHTELVLASYNVRRSSRIEKALYSSPSATSKTKNLWTDICLFARLRVAFHNFRDTALTLPSFNLVTIILVPRPSVPANPSQRPLTLGQTFKILQLDLTAATAQAVIGQNKSVPKFVTEFAKRQKQKPNVHAEVQMILFLGTNDAALSGLLPYFGCSKLSCFVCHRFLESYGRFTTRGCHGRLFRPWTVPGVNGLMPGQADRIAKAIRSVQKEVKKKLTSSTNDPIRHERTSVIGGGSLLSNQQEMRSERQLHIEQLKMKAERDRITEIFRKRAEDLDSITHPGPIREGDEPEDECDICWKPTRRRCTMCNRGFFCSEACQEKRSGYHLFSCSKRPLTSADYLWRSLIEDRMPEEQEVLEEFGFNHLISYRDKTNLLGLYIGLRGKVSAEELHEWRVGGILVDKIKDFYFKISETHRGQYFPWFLKNTHILDRPMTAKEGQDQLMAAFFDKAKPYLDTEDRKKSHKDLTPLAKRESYYLLAEILLQGSPNAQETNFYSFGFVACRNHNEECTLVTIYQLLVTKSDGSFIYDFYNTRRSTTEPVSFTQFWKAFEAGTLIKLMDANGLKNLRSSIPFLEGFLSGPRNRPRLSVWNLKQYVEANDPVKYPPIPSVNVDYGFMNCQTNDDVYTLLEIYKIILRTTSPLDLHEACVTGKLFEFVSGYMKMEEQWRPLLANWYPLEKELGQELAGEASPASECVIQ